MIILCADDYGLSPGVSRGIIELCAADRLSATSALVTSDHWQSQAAALQQIRSTAAVGLHFNLTLGKPLIAKTSTTHLDRTSAFLPISKLIIAALTRRLDASHIQQECSAQIAAFQQATGSLPDFIDGHQHVHALPVIRHGLLAAIREYTWPHSPLIRHPANSNVSLSTRLRAPPKQAIVDWLSSGFTSALRKSTPPHNHSFAGFSTFSGDTDYRTELEAALAHTTNPLCHLVMCHPGHVDDELRNSGDPIIERREQEFDALMATDQLPQRIWHPTRDTNGAIDWQRAISV
jgi:predicted glycoside hydrolase/deacetylase ChbG (UPF0249 family)